MGKGSARRPTDEEKFQANYDKIFGNKELQFVMPVVHMTKAEVQRMIDGCQHPKTCAQPFCNCEVKHEPT